MADDTTNNVQSNTEPADSARRASNGRSSFSLRWDAFNTIIAGAALFFSGLVYYHEYSVRESLAVGLFDYMPAVVNELLAVHIEFAVSNTGNRAAILSDVRLIVPKAKDFGEYSLVPWRGLRITSDKNVISGKQEYIPPILVPSKGLILKNVHFMVELEEIYRESDGEIRLGFCIETINHAGERIANYYGGFNAYVVGGKSAEFDPVPYKWIQLLPVPEIPATPDIRCTRQ